MKKSAFNLILISLLLTCSFSVAQKRDSLPPSKWNHNLLAGLYIFKDDFFVLPVYQVNKDWLHLEARYNYENRKTFSAWLGYNFYGGNKFQYFITPMAGGILGETMGIAPGLELDLTFCGFELYSESEYVFDLQDNEDNFYYNWTDFSYSPLDWLCFGLSVQRTKLYQTELDFQRGIFVGGSYRWFGMNVYTFNLFWDDPYLVVTLSASFPEE